MYLVQPWATTLVMGVSYFFNYGTKLHVMASQTASVGKTSRWNSFPPQQSWLFTRPLHLKGKTEVNKSSSWPYFRDGWMLNKHETNQHKSKWGMIAVLLTHWCRFARCDVAGLWQRFLLLLYPWADHSLLRFWNMGWDNDGTCSYHPMQDSRAWWMIGHVE